MMHSKFTTILSALVLALMLSAGIARADTTTSGGQAIVPPFHLFYDSSSHYLVFHMQIANISNAPVHVVVKYFNAVGEVAKTAEMDLAAKAVANTMLETSSTPGNDGLPFYATIDWTGPHSGQKPLMAHAFARYYYKPGTSAVQDVNSISVNGGLPF